LAKFTQTNTNIETVRSIRFTAFFSEFEERGAWLRLSPEEEESSMFVNGDKV
jgi:hypothetical protein